MNLNTELAEIIERELQNPSDEHPRPISLYSNQWRAICLALRGEGVVRTDGYQERLTVEAVEFYRKHPGGIPQHVLLSMLDELLWIRTAPKKSTPADGG